MELAEQTRRVTEIKHDNVMQELHSQADREQARAAEQKEQLRRISEDQPHKIPEALKVCILSK